MIRRERLTVIACAAWAGIVLSCYYIQLLRALAERQVPLGRDVLVAIITLLLVAAGIVLAGRSGSRATSPASTRTLRVYWSERAAGIALGAAGVATLPWFVLRPQFVAAVAHARLPHFPFAGEAAARFTTGLVGASLVAAAVVSAGTVLLRAAGWRASSRSEHFAFAAVSGVIVLSHGSLLLAVLGIYRPWTAAALIGVLCLAGLAMQRVSGHTPPATVRAGRHADTPWLIVTGLALACAFVAALAPEKEYDALWYHLHLPRLWLESGGPVDVVEEFVSLYPLTWELIFGSGMTLGGVVGAKLLHFACLPLLATLTWHAARRYLPSASPIAAVVLVVTTPTMLWEAGTAYVDLALALHAAAGCYALARFWEQDERAWAIVAALQFGTAAATKHLGVFVALIALALYVAAALRAGRGARWACQRGLLIGIAAALLPLPWYVRSWLASGNPIFPEMWGLFGASPAQRWDVISELGLVHFKAHFGIGRSLGDLIALPWDVTVHGALFSGSLGPLFLVLAPGMFLARRHDHALPWLCAGAGCYLALWASPISSYQMRFLMPVVPALALIGAACLDSIAACADRNFTQGRRAVNAMVLILATMNLPAFIRWQEADRVVWDGWLTHVLRAMPLAVITGRESESAYLSREVSSYAAWRAIETTTPPGARILTFTGGDRLYASRRYVPYDSTMARAVLSATAQEAARAAEALRGLGVTHVLFDRRELSRWDVERVAISSAAFQQGCIREYDDQHLWLCRLDYGRLLAAVRGVPSATGGTYGRHARSDRPDGSATTSRDRQRFRPSRFARPAARESGSPLDRRNSSVHSAALR